MGNDFSNYKNHAVSPCDYKAMANTNLSLRFHQIHGDNIKLSSDGSIAFRSEGFCKGIVFSDRPIKVGERVYIKFIDISTYWSGALRIGFTMHDPLSLKSKLPRYACPDLILNYGNWAKAIEEQSAIKDSILAYYVDKNGYVHYSVNDEECGIFFGGVNVSVKLWALLDIYGNTLAIQLIDPLYLNQKSQDYTNNLNNEIDKLSDDMWNLQLNPLYFHEIYGNNSMLKQKRCVLSRKKSFDDNSFGFIERPLKFGEMIIIQITKCDKPQNGTLTCGITKCDPSSFGLKYKRDKNQLLENSNTWTIVDRDDVYSIGDVIIVSISLKGEIQVIKNELPISSISPFDSNNHSLWLMVNLNGTISEVILVGRIAIHDSTNLSKLQELLKNSLLNFNMDTPPPTQKISHHSSSNDCVICCEETVNCALYRCGHMCMCFECATKIWTGNQNHCPICRNIIKDVIKIYK